MFQFTVWAYPFPSVRRKDWLCAWQTVQRAAKPERKRPDVIVRSKGDRDVVNRRCEFIFESSLE